MTKEDSMSDRRLNAFLHLAVVTILFAAGVSLIFAKATDAHHPGGLLYEDPRKIPGIIAVREVPIAPGAMDADLVDSVDLSSQMPPIGNQGTQASCVGWAMGYYHKTHTEWIEHRWNVNDPRHQFSPAFIYNQINGGVDQGAYFSHAMRLICEQGVANMVDCPYNQNDYTTWPSESAYSRAIPFRGESYYWIGTRDSNGLRQIRQMLVNGYTVVLGIYIWSNFDNIRNFNNTYCVADRYGTNRGGHAVTIVGYNNNKPTRDGPGAFKLANSWGTGWGAQGYFWMSYLAVMDSLLSQRWACYVSDRIGYRPTLLGRVRITHSARDKIGIQMGVGSTSAPFWTKNFREWRYSIQDRSFPPNNMVFDMTEGEPYISNGNTESVFVRCIDDVADGKTGTINFYSCQHLPWGVVGVSSDPPVGIPDQGVAVYARARIRPAHDVGVLRILIPSGIIDSGSVITPQARVKNYGTQVENFPVTFRIGTFYTNTQNVSNLNPGDSTVVSFSPWTALQRGTHTTKCTTRLTGDVNPANDFVRDSVRVIPRIGIKEPPFIPLIPRVFALESNFPNPFASQTLIRYALPKDCRVNLQVYNSSGILVRTLKAGIEKAGFYRVIWNGCDEKNRKIPNGIYFYRLEAGEFTAMKKMVKIE